MTSDRGVVHGPCSFGTSLSNTTCGFCCANACAIGETSLSPYALLAEVKKIEADMGREPSRRWGPRLIDVDILFLGDHTLDDPELTLPHKELFGRGFVLLPLAEIAPKLVLDDVPIEQALASVDVAGVELWSES